MKYVQYFLTLIVFFSFLLEFKQVKAAPVCAADHLSLACDPDTQYVWFRVNHCYVPTPNPNDYKDHLAECKSKPSNACIPRIETISPTNISGTACGSGGTYWCDRPDDGMPVSWRCFCAGCGSPPTTCDTHTRTIDVTAIPLQMTLINTRDSACGGNPDLPAESTYNIDALPYVLPSGASVPELNFMTNSFTYTWKTSTASPPTPPPSCLANGVQCMNWSCDNEPLPSNNCASCCNGWHNVMPIPTGHVNHCSGGDPDGPQPLAEKRCGP